MQQEYSDDLILRAIQISVINNAKTMFRVMNEFKKVDLPQPNVVNEIKNSQTNQTINAEANGTKQNGPIFFQ